MEHGVVHEAASKRLSEHFRRAEFACKCGCGFGQVDPALVAGLERLRASFVRPVIVLSGCRCAAHNAAVGGAMGSLHLAGRAADIRIEGVRPRVVFREAQRIPQLRGFGLDEARGFVHVDTRDLTALWQYRGGHPVAWEEAAAEE